MDTFFEDLYDIEQRPGAGLQLWANTAERQLERVRDANYRHCLHHSPNPDEQRDDPGAEEQLHAEVYFLALAIRRVLLFVELLARQVDDPRLLQARATFASQGADSKRLRDFLRPRATPRAPSALNAADLRDSLSRKEKCKVHAAAQNLSVQSQRVGRERVAALPASERQDARALDRAAGASRGGGWRP
jgi:hypothetical protein